MLIDTITELEQKVEQKYQEWQDAIAELHEVEEQRKHCSHSWTWDGKFEKCERCGILKTWIKYGNY